MTRRHLARAVAVLVVVTILGAVGACTGPPGTSGPSAPAASVAASVTGLVHAGPVCPVSKPGDPACADRPVSGAVLIVTTPAGVEVARATSVADGTFGVALPAGDYVLVPQPVSGLMGTPSSVPFHVAGDGGVPPALDVAYDTGIR
jgi:hypothetical protein